MKRSQLYVRDFDDEESGGDDQFGEFKDGSRDKECSGSDSGNKSGEKTNGGHTRDEPKDTSVNADVVFDKVHFPHLVWLWIHPMSISYLFQIRTFDFRASPTNRECTDYVDGSISNV